MIPHPLQTTNSSLLLMKAFVKPLMFCLRFRLYLACEIWQHIHALHKIKAGYIYAASGAPCTQNHSLSFLFKSLIMFSFLHLIFGIILGIFDLRKRELLMQPVLQWLSFTSCVFWLNIQHIFVMCVLFFFISIQINCDSLQWKCQQSVNHFISRCFWQVLKIAL